MTNPTKRQLRQRIDNLADGGDSDAPLPTPDLSKAEKDALDSAFDPAKETPPDVGLWLKETYGLTPATGGILP